MWGPTESSRKLSPGGSESESLEDLRASQGRVCSGQKEQCVLRPGSVDVDVRECVASSPAGMGIHSVWPVRDRQRDRVSAPSRLFLS